MEIDHRFPRQKGNLLPHPVPAEKTGECKRYFIDPKKFATDGIVEAITEPEHYEMPEGISWATPFELPSNNAEAVKMRRENFRNKKINKPSKEELASNMKIMTLKQLAKKYKVASSTISSWIKEYKLQRTNSPECKNVLCK